MEKSKILSLSEELDTLSQSQFKIISEMGEYLPEDGLYRLLDGAMKHAHLRDIFFAKLASGELSKKVAKFVTLVEILEK